MALTDTGAGRTITSHNAGMSHPKVTLAGTCKLGDPLGYATGWKRSDPDTAAGPIRVQLIAMQDGVSGDTISVCTQAIIKGFTLGTVGGLVYQKDADVGKWAEAAPGDGGDDKTPYGVILAADTILVTVLPQGPYLTV